MPSLGGALVPCERDIVDIKKKQEAHKKRLASLPVEPREETHMEVFRRLAAVKNMHGTPGDPHKKHQRS